MDRGIVPAVCPENAYIPGSDGCRSRGQLDGEVAQSAQTRLEICLPVVVCRVLRELLVCALCTEVVCVRDRSVVTVVVPRGDGGEQFPLRTGQS